MIFFLLKYILINVTIKILLYLGAGYALFLRVYTLFYIEEQSKTYKKNKILLKSDIRTKQII